MPRKTVIDGDSGVDDALAILLAFGLPEVEVLALTTVAGHCEVRTATRNALALCELAAHRGLTVAMGASRPL
mgnify:CR=1 FL=1